MKSHITLPSPYLEVQHDELVLPGGRGPARATLALSSEGKQAYRNAVLRSLRGCLEEKTIASGCGLKPEASLGHQPVEGTITRTMPPEDLARIQSIKVTDAVGRPGTVTNGAPLGTVTMEFQCAGQSSEKTCTSQRQLREAKIDMTRPQLVVEWS